MDFRVPPTKYRLIVTPQKPVDAFGRSRLADVDFTKHQVKVWDKIHGRARESLVREELDIAWHRHALVNKLGHGVIANEPVFFENDLRRQGGRIMLDHAKPGRTRALTKTGLVATLKTRPKAKDKGKAPMM